MKYITDTDEFDALIKSGKKVLVDFFAEWCGPCMMLAPVIEKIANEHTDIEVVKVDVDKAMELAIRFGVESIPLLLFFKDGETKGSLIGLTEKEKIEALISNE